MRKVYLITATSMLLIFGCKKNSLNEKNIVLSEEESLKKAVSQLGFNTNEMIVNGDTLIVDEDIILYKSQLLKNGVMETMPRQAKAHNATLDKTAINIFISNNFSATERNLIISSLNEFRTANLTSVGGAGFSEINYVTNQGSADASIQWGTMNSNVCGYA